MDENSEVMEFEDDSADELEMADELSDLIDDDWYEEDFKREEADGTLNEVTEDAEDEAETDQSEAESEESEEDTEETEDAEEPQQKTDPFMRDLKYLGEKFDVATEEEARTLIQMGKDYNRIRTERDSLRTDLADYTRLKEAESQNSEMVGFVKRLADIAGQSVEDFMDSTDARLMSTKEGEKRTREEIYSDLQSERQDRVLQKQESEKQAEKSKEMQMFDAFSTVYPDVKAEDIPMDVWTDLQEGKGSLTALYSHYLRRDTESENAKLKAEIETLKQNQKNKERSTGSRKSSGKAAAEAAFDALWYDGT